MGNNSEQRLSEEEYKYIFNRVPRICVDVLIRKDNGIILTKRDIEPNKGTWHIPGGRLMRYESIQQAIDRIASKEVGVKVTTEKFLGYIEYIHDGSFVHSVSLAFLASYKSGTLQNDYQSKEIQLFSALPENMYPQQGEFIKAHRREIFGG